MLNNAISFGTVMNMYLVMSVR